MEALLGGHGGGEHLEADGAGQLGLQVLGRDGDLLVVRDGLLRRAVQLVQRQVPRLAAQLRHFGPTQN